MASTSSSHQQNLEDHAFSGIEPPSKRRKASESSRLFDVFINHRGPDVKQTLALQLYNSLKELELRVFLDSEEKELGESFPAAIETAIRSASVQIAIFSTRYAESAWCLAELVLMIESEAKIIPVFYGVKPWELRYIESGVYADAFTKYKEKGRYLQKLDKWREALESASLITGALDFNNSGECIKNIVLSVQKEVTRTKPLPVAKYPVGLQKLVEDFERRCIHDVVQDFERQCSLGENRCGLTEKGKDHSKIVGIFGMGGAGKTTLAKELFNRKCSKYIKACFLFDVREASTKCELPSLQIKLLRDLFDEEPPIFHSREETTMYVRDRLRRSSFLSFLIVLDDIDHVKQLDELLVVDMLKNSKDSLIIVTTRDVGVLRRKGITIQYNLKGLNRNDGRELFCWHSFGQPHPTVGYEDLVDEFVGICEGLPLSLQVLGRHVYGSPDYYWRLQLDKVCKTLHGDIKEKLKISFDALDSEEKQIFMDIACFFVDKSKSMAISVWEGSGWSARHALETLKDRCLVQEMENFNGLLWQDRVALKMHDHLRDLGREMANDLNSSPRLWHPQHLKSLDSKGFQNILTQTKCRCLHSIFDRSMGSQITYFLGGSDDSAETSTLLWLQLDLQCRFHTSIPSWIPLQNLQCLRLGHGYFKRLWQTHEQAPFQLKELQMYQTTLEEFPDALGMSNNLETVLLDAYDLPIQGWSLLKSLRVYPRSLVLKCSTLSGELALNDRRDSFSFKPSYFKSLVIRNFSLSEQVALNNGGESSDVMSPMHRVENLEISNEELVTQILICGNYCPSLQSVKLHDIENLFELDLLRVNTLQHLMINNCQNFKRLSGTSGLGNLAAFSISQCPEFLELDLLGVNTLQHLKINNCQNFERLSGTSGLGNLAALSISQCPEFPELCVARQSCLERISVYSCGKLKRFDLNGCKKLKTVSVKGDLPKFVKLNISDCPLLEELPFLQDQRCLESITIDGCGKLNQLDLEFLNNLKFLELKGCKGLKTVSGLENLQNLVKLNICDCPMLEELPFTEYQDCLESITIDGCGKPNQLDLEFLNNLKFLELKGCKGLKTVSGLENLQNLVKLNICDCPMLEELHFPEYQDCLESITIDGCGKLNQIDLEFLDNLKFLELKGCKGLKTVSGLENLEKLVQLNICDCPMLRSCPFLNIKIVWRVSQLMGV